MPEQNQNHVLCQLIVATFGSKPALERIFIEVSDVDRIDFAVRQFGADANPRFIAIPDVGVVAYHLPASRLNLHFKLERFS